VGAECEREEIVQQSARERKNSRVRERGDSAAECEREEIVQQSARERKNSRVKH
jgi:hypothetical protein